METREVNWVAIQIEPSDNSTCDSCGLPGYALKKVENWDGQARSVGVKDIIIHPAVAYKIPGIPWCCSISCLECVLFGPGRCRECGVRFGEKSKSFGRVEYEHRAGQRYCDKCSAHEHSLGERLLAYLRKYEAGIYTAVVGAQPERKKRSPNRAYLERLNSGISMKAAQTEIAQIEG